jgi:hypothetical protein
VYLGSTGSYGVLMEDNLGSLDPMGSLGFLMGI